MGYETNLYVGSVMKRADNESAYFLKMANIDLCKCGYTGTLPNLIAKATNEKNTNNYQEVHWSEMLSVGEGARKEILKNGWVSEENIEDVCVEIEEWESEVNEDCYGSKLRAVPIKEVYDAMLKSQAECIVDDGEGYRRYTVALGMLKGFMEGFGFGEGIYCVLYGH